MTCRHMPRTCRIYSEGGYTCTRCGKYVTAEAISRGRRANRRGRRLNAKTAKESGAENVETLQVPEDQRGSYLDAQHKSGKGYPKLLDRWLRAIPKRDGRLRAVIYTETPGPGRKARQLVVFDYGEYREWHGA